MLEFPKTSRGRLSKRHVRAKGFENARSRIVRFILVRQVRIIFGIEEFATLLKSQYSFRKKTSRAPRSFFSHFYLPVFLFSLRHYL